MIEFLQVIIMKKEINPEIKKLQINLSSLRRLAGWTAADLGEKVGVTKQTISNLETGRTEMTKMQYIAIRSVLDYKARNNEALNKAMALVLSDTDSSAEDQKRNEEKVKAAAAASVAGVDEDILTSILGAVASVAVVGIASWLAKIIDQKV